MVKVGSPNKKKRLSLKIKYLLGLEFSKNDVYDNDRLLILNLEKGGAVALLDKHDNLIELSRNMRGQFSAKVLKNEKTKEKKIEQIFF